MGENVISWAVNKAQGGADQLCRQIQVKIEALAAEARSLDELHDGLIPVEAVSYSGSCHAPGAEVWVCELATFMEQVGLDLGGFKGTLVDHAQDLRQVRDDQLRTEDHVSREMSDLDRVLKEAEADLDLQARRTQEAAAPVQTPGTKG
jgi:hypothetical protein